MDKDERQSIIEIWKTVVQVQQHFNDIGMKIRGLFITIVVAVAAAQGFLLEKRLSFSIGSLTILFATFIPVLGIVATYLFYFMDRYWYHRLLLGAVMQGAEIENKYKEQLPELSLGAKISALSPVELKSRFGRWVADRVVSDERYVKHKRLHSDAKIELFYKSVVYSFGVWLVFTITFAGVLVNNETIFELVMHQAQTHFCGPAQ